MQWHRPREGRLSIRRYWHLVFKCLLWILGLLYLSSMAIAEPLQFPGDFEIQIVALSINAQPMGQGVIALRSPAKEWLLPATALRAANVNIAGLSVVRFEEGDYIPLGAFDVTRVRFDELQQSLDVQMAAEMFAPTRLHGRDPRNFSDIARPAGGFINYDLLIEHAPNGAGFTLFTELGSAVGRGVGIANFLFIDRPELRESLRLDTAFTMDDVGRAESLRLGDTISRPSTILGRAVRFGGLRWGSNFQTQPGLVTVPVATLAGQAALPSTLDLYVDNVLQTRSAIPPGPFSISTPPMVAGDGEVLLKVTDIAGQQQIISQPFYASMELLAPGLSDYSLEVGALRQNYGLRSNDYGHAFISGSWRQGISDGLTVEAGAGVEQQGPTGLLAGMSTAIAGIGTGTIAVGASRDDAGAGFQIGWRFDRRTARHSFSARTQIADKDYRQTGVDATQAVRRLDSLFYGYRMGELGSLGVAYTRQQRATMPAISIVSVSVSSRQSRWGHLGMSLVQTRADQTDTSLNFFWSMSFGSGVSASAFHWQPGRGESGDSVTLQKNMAPGEGWGYRLQAARNAAQQAFLYGQNDYAAGRLEFAELEGQTSVRTGIAGGVAFVDGKSFFSRRIDGSFGLIRMPGFPNVRIYVENQLASHTNADGYALLPRLSPYMKNNVSIEQLDIPLDAQIDTLKTYPIPAWRSAVLIDVSAKPAANATVELFLDDGKPVPAGASAIIIFPDGRVSEPFAIGHDGLLYLAGLTEKNQIQVVWPTGQCTAYVAYVPEKGNVPHLGRFNCLGSGVPK